MATTEREDALDRKLSGQSKTDRLIDGAAALIAGQAYDLMLSHTVNGKWPEWEAGVKAEHDMLLEMVGELRELKGNSQGILGGSGHIPDATKMITGNVVNMGEMSEDGETYFPAMLIEFASFEDFHAARAAGQCRFTVFGGEV